MIATDRALADVTVNDGFDALVTKIAKEGQVPCASYKHSCLRRRVSVRLRATGALSFAHYGTLLDTQPGEWAHLMNALTINVTGFFRDVTVFDALRETVLPALASEHRGVVRAWSAGCASGEEPWTLAMLLADVVELAKLDVIATDIDVASLQRARKGEYPLTVTHDIPERLRSAWWTGTDPMQVRPTLQRCVSFRTHNMLVDDAPGDSLDLITCRNVIIYFARHAQEALFLRFADALRIGGVLVLGKVEMLTGPARSRFAVVDARERIYRRIA